jgi:DNA-binding response OmpR family regulator
MPSSILIFGYDDHLLNSRRWVLEGQGYVVKTTFDLKEAGQILSTGQIDLLILCQTLSAEDYASALALARSKQPAIGILVMDPDSTKRTATDGTTILTDFPSPKSFIDAVRETTGRKGLSFSGVS